MCVCECTRVYMCVSVCILMINSSFGFPGIFRHIHNYFSPLFRVLIFNLSVSMWYCVCVCVCMHVFIYLYMVLHSIVTIFVVYLLFLYIFGIVVAQVLLLSRWKIVSERVDVKKCNKWLTNVRHNKHLVELKIQAKKSVFSF